MREPLGEASGRGGMADGEFVLVRPLCDLCSDFSPEEEGIGEGGRANKRKKDSNCQWISGQQYCMLTSLFASKKRYEKSNEKISLNFILKC